MSKSIFITNIFAQSHPEEHVKLWNRFVKEVPPLKRNGYYGAENDAYVRWLKEQNDPVFDAFVQEQIIGRGN